MQRFLVLALGAAVSGCESFASVDAPPDAATTNPAADGGGADGSIDPTGDGGGGGGSDATTTPDLTLLAYWKMDDNDTVVTDSVGQNHGTRSGGAWLPGKIGGAFSTSNATGRVIVPFAPTLAITNDFTFAAWVNLDAKQPGDDSYVFTHGYAFYVKLNSRWPQVGVGGGYYNVTREVPPGGWHHLAVTFATGVAHIFVDGIEGAQRESTLKAASLPDASTKEISIGSGNGGSTGAIGLIDDVRLYRRALSASEIAALTK